MLHFAQLVNWPAAALPNRDTPLVFCAFDDDPARQEIRDTVEGKRMGARGFRFRALRVPQDGRGCHILFIGQTVFHRQLAALKALEGAPVLTVGESESFFSDGGMIRFHPDDAKRVRFDVNIGAAEACGIKISSRLLLHASYVLRNSPENLGGR